MASICTVTLCWVIESAVGYPDSSWKCVAKSERRQQNWRETGSWIRKKRSNRGFTCQNLKNDKRPEEVVAAERHKSQTWFEEFRSKVRFACSALISGSQGKRFDQTSVQSSKFMCTQCENCNKQVDVGNCIRCAHSNCLLFPVSGMGGTFVQVDRRVGALRVVQGCCTTLKAWRSEYISAPVGYEKSGLFKDTQNSLQSCEKSVSINRMWTSSGLAVAIIFLKCVSWGFRAELTVLFQVHILVWSAAIFLFLLFFFVFPRGIKCCLVKVSFCPLFCEKTAFKRLRLFRVFICTSPHDWSHVPQAVIPSTNRKVTLYPNKKTEWKQ